MRRTAHPEGTNVVASGAGALAVAALTVALAISCASSAAPIAKPESASERPFALASKGSPLEAQGLSAFAKENLASFSTFTLSNGLPVVVKKNSANRVQHITLVIRGGAATTDPAHAGIEALALRTMTRGSAKYSYEDIQSLEDESSSGIWSSSDFDYSTYSLTTLDKYFERLFPVWADTLAEPSFTQTDFAQVLSQARLSLQSKEQDPWAKTGLELNRILFAGHPYASSPEGTEASLSKATLDDVKAWYAARMRADSLFVVAVGDFQAESLRSQLEAGLGRLPAVGAAPIPAPGPLSRAGPGSLAKIEFPQSRGMGYLRGDFPAPPPTDPDYVPLALGMKVLSDLLFDVVRDKHGAAYSPDAFIRSFQANYGSITLFKTKNPGKAKTYIDDAVRLLASGKAIAPDPRSSKDGYAPLADALDAVKAEFINSLYESQATNAAIASRIAWSVIALGDYRGYLLDVDRIRAVTAAQVQAAVNKYLVKGSIAWVALGSSEVLIPAQAADFALFAPEPAR